MNSKSQSNIKVAIRVRPMLPKELNNKEFKIIKIDDKILHAFDPLDNLQKNGKKSLEIYHRSRQ